MKMLKRIVAWITVSIVIQCSILFYLNNYVFSAKSSFNAKKIVEKATNKKDVEVKVPDNAQHVNVSFDAKYLAFYDEGILRVINTKTGDTKEVEFDKNVKVSFYKWIPDRNRMLIAEKITTKSTSGFKLSYYDVDKDVKEPIKDLTWADSKSEVEDIQVSTLTNVIYVKVAHSGKRSSIYWIDIQKQMKKVDAKSYIIGTIVAMPHEDKLIYEDQTYHTISVTNMSKPITIKDVKASCLLGVDGDDNIYIGGLDGENVTSVYTGTLKQNTSMWNVTKLSGEYQQSDIFVSFEGKIYLNDGLKGIVHDMKTGKDTPYKGKLIQIYSEGIASISDGKLIKTIFK